jgi:hypothetical protein
VKLVENWWRISERVSYAVFGFFFGGQWVGGEAGSEVAADFQGVQERALGACLAIRRGNLFRCRPILPR